MFGEFEIALGPADCLVNPGDEVLGRLLTQLFRMVAGPLFPLP